MKKLKVLIVAACFLAAGNVATAQTKIAYINVDQVLSLMPGTAKIDSLLMQYRQDTIQPEYNSLLTNYQFKDSLYRDSLHTPKAVRDQVAKELPAFIYQLQNWNQIEQQALEARQSQLLAPIYKEISDAIKAIAKEKGYTHVMTREVFIVAPDADDLFTAVTQRLKLKVPPPQVPPR